MKQPWEMTRAEYWRSKMTDKPEYMIRNSSNLRSTYTEHKLSVEKAIENGETTPQSVIDDYQDKDWECC